MIKNEKLADLFVEGFVSGIEQWKKEEHKKTVEEILIEDLHIDLEEKELRQTLNEFIRKWRKRHPKKG